MNTIPANTPERDQRLRVLAAQVSATLTEQPADIAIGAAVLYLVCLCDTQPVLNRYTAIKLRQVADLLDPP